MVGKQTKKGSLLEACTNTAIGYSISFVLNYFMHWFYDIEISTAQNLGMGAVFTVVSVVRSYVVRRMYNHFGWFQNKKIKEKK